MSYYPRLRHLLLSLTVCSLALTSGVFQPEQAFADTVPTKTTQKTPPSANNAANPATTGTHPAAQTPQTTNVTKQNRLKSIPVLMYHSINTNDTNNSLIVTPEQFDKNVTDLLKNGYTPITATELDLAWESGHPLPSKPILITFDDGYEDNFTNAFPILQKHKVKATIFIITGSVGRRNYLTWDQIRTMHQSGLIDIESHSVTHRDITRLSAKEFSAELTESKKALETELKKTITIFSYPYGQQKRAYMPILKQAGYKMAFSTQTGLASFTQGVYYVKRIKAMPEQSFVAILQSATPTKLTKAPAPPAKTPVVTTNKAGKAPVQTPPKPTGQPAKPTTRPPASPAQAPPADIQVSAAPEQTR